MMIAGGILLCGVLLALRYPADREEELVAAQPVVAGHNAQLSSSPTMSRETPQEQAFVASRNDEGERFEPIQDFVTRMDSQDWSPTSMSEQPGSVTNDTEEPAVDETSVLDRDHYATMPVNRTNSDYQPLVSEAEPVTPPEPEYIPFLATPVTMPATNPAFLAASPLPLNFTGIQPTVVAAESVVPSVEPRPVISPSAEQLPIVITNRVESVAPALPVSPSEPIAARSPTTLARPIVPVSGVQEARQQPVVRPVISNIRESQHDVISAPAKTIILPN